MSNKLQKVMRLARKTGDRVVVFDNNEPDDSFVVMPLEEYEEILGLNEPNGENFDLTEEKIADKIENSGQKKIWQNDRNFHKENIYSSGQVLKDRYKGNNNWSIPKSVKAAAVDIEDEPRE
jgi:PHD/YefM family antitoxin component YafN of YafNO toxin-antitoxin module